MTFTQTDSSSLPASALQAEPTVERYFASFNAGDFATTAALFAADGTLNPPFESAIAGKAAIADYLQTEAEGMQAYPAALEVEPMDAGCRRVVVQGQVKALVFKVNVAWTFELNEYDQIGFAKVKLLASMQELLTLRA